MSEGSNAITSAADLLTISPVVPVVVIRDAEQAVPLARALVCGGVAVIEITLRTEAGLSAIERHGLNVMKFFPAEPSGGVAYLSAVAGPLPQLRFCPTGGISVKTAPNYLALANVGCVGGSWLTPADAMAANDWERIESLAAEAATIQPA